MRNRPRVAEGFSILEMTVAMGIMLAVTATMFSLLHPSEGAFAVEPEAADMQQRIRVAADTLTRHLMMAGAGPYQTARAAPLVYHFAPVLPFRRGTSNDDPPGTFDPGAITIAYVPSTPAQSTLASNGPDASHSDVSIGLDPGCPVGDAACGFTAGMTALLYDDHGNADVFSVASVVAGGRLVLRQSDRTPPFDRYLAGSTRITEAVNRVYSLKADTAAATYQLTVRDGPGGNELPVVDHVVALSFEYFGDPRPPRVSRPLSDPDGPWTTYGPKPDMVPFDAYAAGENCVFVNDGLASPSPRLPDLGGADAALVPLTAAQLTDGPWCPNASSPHRWDADLLRIRRIAVTLRVQAANAALRGPAGALFAHGGSSRGGKWLPDYELHMQVAPRNLNLGR